MCTVHAILRAEKLHVVFVCVHALGICVLYMDKHVQ